MRVKRSSVGDIKARLAANKRKQEEAKMEDRGVDYDMEARIAKSQDQDAKRKVRPAVSWGVQHCHLIPFAPLPTHHAALSAFQRNRRSSVLGRRPGRKRRKGRSEAMRQVPVAPFSV